MKQKLILGQIYETNNFGKIEIIQEAETISFNKKQWPEKYYLIKFLNSGYQKFASATAIQSGRVKDPTVPFIANKAYVGSDIKISTDPKIFMFYKSWNDMINRCYNITDHDYPYYGGLGIAVEERWFNFSLFLLDIMHLPNYDKKLKYPDIYQLDKDYLQLNIPKSQRIYSRQTCIWISKYDNILVMNRDCGTRAGYYGVFIKDNSYSVSFNNIIYGRFSNLEAAANFFNIVYTKYFRNYEFNDICILNDVPYMSPQEIWSYTKNKQRWLVNSMGEIELII